VEIGISRPRRDAAGYWIPTRWDSEVAREGGESNPSKLDQMCRVRRVWRGKSDIII